MQMKATDGAASGSRGRTQKWRGKEGRKSREGEEKNVLEKKEGKGVTCPSRGQLFSWQKSILVPEIFMTSIFFFYK